MSNEELRRQIYSNLNLKETDELVSSGRQTIAMNGLTKHLKLLGRYYRNVVSKSPNRMSLFTSVASLMRVVQEKPLKMMGLMSGRRKRWRMRINQSFTTHLKSLP